MRWHFGPPGVSRLTIALTTLCLSSSRLSDELWCRLNSRTLVSFAVVTLLVMSFACYWLFVNVCTNTTYNAKYPRMYLYGPARNAYSHLITGNDTGGAIAKIYVRFPNGSIYHFPEIPESVIAQYCHSVAPPRNADPETFLVPPNNLGVSTYATISHFTFFQFRKGQLTYAHLNLTDIQIGSSKSGPFYELPIPQDDLELAFGKAEKYVSRSPMKFVP